MKAISIRQPWAFAITNLGKRVENRDRNTSVRGRVLIHAAKGCTSAEYVAARDFMVARGLAAADGLACLQTSVPGCEPPVLPPLAEMQRGGFVATAKLVEVLPRAGSTNPWHVTGCYGYVLEDVAPIEFLPYRGELGFFNVPDDVVAAARVVRA